jgi:hypothetical protein
LNGGGAEVAGAELRQEMANKRSGQTLDQLQFFTGRQSRGADGFCALKLTPAGAWPSRAAPGSDGPTCRWSGLRRRSGCVPAEPYPPLKHRPE